MSGSPSGATPADVDFEGLAEALYALRPDAFAAARDGEVKQARADRRTALARQLAQLRRPTQSAWLINLLWRDQRGVMDQLFQVADELGRAQARASGAELRSLSARRQELETALVRRAQALAGQAGVTVTASVEREVSETLAAALARPEVADEIRSGRLLKPAIYAGFGIFPPAVAPPRDADAAVSDPPAGGNDQASVDRAASSEQPPTDDVEQQHQHRARELREQAEQRRRARRQEAERGVEDAKAALQAAAAVLAQKAQAAEAADQQRVRLRAQLEALEAQLRGLRTDSAVAEDAALFAARQRDQADKTHAAALQALDHAERNLLTTPEVETPG